MVAQKQPCSEHECIYSVCDALTSEVKPVRLFKCLNDDIFICVIISSRPLALFSVIEVEAYRMVLKI